LQICEHRHLGGSEAHAMQVLEDFQHMPADMAGVRLIAWSQPKEGK
jgi:hypothetical protein